MTGLKRAGKMALAVLAGVATGVVAWQMVQRRRRVLRERDLGRVMPRPPAAPALKADHHGDNTEARLDEGIEESFPASDPVSIRIE